MLVGSQVRRVAILGGLRIPFARAYGAYATAGNQDMLTETFRALVQRYKLTGEHLGDVIAGAVIKHSRDYNLVRESVLSSGLAPSTPGLDIQRACGTSLEAAILVGNKIALGQMEAGIAGGWIRSAIRPSSIRAPTSSCCCAVTWVARPWPASSRSSACGRGTSSR